MEVRLICLIVVGSVISYILLSRPNSILLMLRRRTFVILVAISSGLSGLSENIQRSTISIEAAAWYHVINSISGGSFSTPSRCRCHSRS